MNAYEGIMPFNNTNCAVRINADIKLSEYAKDSGKPANENTPFDSVSKKDWNDWKWQFRNRITSLEKLDKIIALPETNKADVLNCLEKFRMAITPYYASLMDFSDPDCPVRKQSIPCAEELCNDTYGIEDPLGEDHYSPVPNIVHKYPDRVLFLVTRMCSMYCRHCTRRRMVGEEDFSISEHELEAALGYINKNKAIRDVLISGGDPLILSDSVLEKIISRVRSIEHVEIIRIGTRVPVVMPMRITGNLVRMLRKYHPIWINTHFNHPKEITPESAEACRKIVDAGIPLGNQTVLLKGVNNDPAVMRALLTGLVKIRVRPYYLYQCDMTKGIEHFRTTISEGIEIMKSLRGYLSGFAVPTYVVDAPGGGGKIPVGHNYIVTMDEERALLENYLGLRYIYTNPDITSECSR